MLSIPETGPGAESLLILSPGWRAEMLKVACLGLAFRTCSLAVRKSLHSPSACVEGWLWMGGGTWVKCTEHWAAPVGHLGAPQTKCMQGLVSGHPHRVCRALRSREPLMRPTPWLLGFQPLPASKPRRAPQYPGWGEKEVSILAMSHTAGETRQPLTTFSPSLLAIVPPWGRGKVQLFLLPPSLHPVLGFLLP